MANGVPPFTYHWVPVYVSRPPFHALPNSVVLTGPERIGGEMFARLSPLTSVVNRYCPMTGAFAEVWLYERSFVTSIACTTCATACVALPRKSTAATAVRIRPRPVLCMS